MRLSARITTSSVLVVLAAVPGGAVQTRGVTVPSIVSAKLDTEGLSQLLVPVRVNDANLWCNLGTNDEVPASLMLDTGASYYCAVLMNSFVTSHDILSRIGQVVPEVSHTPNLALAAGRLTRMMVGPFEIAEPVITLIQTRRPASSTTDSREQDSFSGLR